MEETLRSRLETDMKAAMKAGDTTARDTIRFILAAVKNAEIDKGGQLDADEGEALLQRQAKRMSESIEAFNAGNRSDLAEREAVQLAIVKRYLPAELTDAEITALAESVVAEVGATSAKEMAKVMPLLIERAANRADGRRLSAAAKAALSGRS